jgi:predicted DNA-binding ribbon-helix-helix protein
MVQTSQRLELPAPLYETLAQIARSRGTTPARVIEVWIEQHQDRDVIHALRQEYQQLVEKDLAHALTPDEEQRLDALCDELSDRELRSEGNAAWEERAAAMDARFARIEHLLTGMPEKPTQS